MDNIHWKQVLEFCGEWRYDQWPSMATSFFLGSNSVALFAICISQRSLLWSMHHRPQGKRAVMPNLQPATYFQFEKHYFQSRSSVV